MSTNLTPVEYGDTIEKVFGKVNKDFEKTDNNEQRLDDVDKSMLDARNNSVTGVTHVTLADRLDADSQLIKDLGEKQQGDVDLMEIKHESDINELKILKANRSEYIESIKALQSQLDSLVLGAVGDGNNAEVIQARGGFKTLTDRLLKNDIFVSDLVDLLIKDDIKKLVKINCNKTWNYERLPYGIKITKLTDAISGNSGFIGDIPIDLIPEKITFKATTTNYFVIGIYLFDNQGNMVKGNNLKNYMTLPKGIINEYTELLIPNRENMIQYIQNNPNIVAKFLLNNDSIAGFPFKAGEQAILENLAFDSDSYTRIIMSINNSIISLNDEIFDINTLLNNRGIRTYDIYPLTDDNGMEVHFLKTGMQITWKQEQLTGNKGISINLHNEIPSEIIFDLASSECGVNQGLYVRTPSRLTPIAFKNYEGRVENTHIQTILTPEQKAKAQQLLNENPNNVLKYVMWNNGICHVGDWIRVTNFQVDAMYLPYPTVYNQVLKNSKDIESLSASKVEFSDLRLDNIDIRDKFIWKFDGKSIDKWTSIANVEVVNGKIHFIYSSETGNAGFKSGPMNYSKTSNGFLKIKIRASEIITGIYGVYIFGSAKSTSNAKFILLKNYTTTVENILSVDLNYFGVYNDLDLSKSFTILINNSGICDMTFDKFEVWDDYSQLDQTKTFTENLNIMKTDIESLKIEKPKEMLTDAEMVDENGNKYILQSYSGQLKLIPKIPKNVLYIGNSLLLGFGTFGMCASNNSEDYYTYTNNYIKQFHSQLLTDKLQGSPYEACVTSQQQDSFLTTTILPKLNDTLELVVIQLGDNVNTAEKLAVFEEGSKKICKFIRTHAPNARVAWVAAWYTNNTKQQWISNACTLYGCKFIDIVALHSVSGNQSHIGAIITYPDGTTKTVDSDGVASHPSSQGMKQISDKIITELFK